MSTQTRIDDKFITAKYDLDEERIMVNAKPLKLGYISLSELIDSPKLRIDGLTPDEFKELVLTGLEKELSKLPKNVKVIDLDGMYDDSFDVIEDKKRLETDREVKERLKKVERQLREKDKKLADARKLLEEAGEL